MINITSKSECCGCSSCAQICPKKCIDMTEDEEGFLYPLVDKSKCIDCGLCEKSCPILKNEKSNDTISAYACQNIDETTRLRSSSGGTFSLLSEYVLDNNGVVFGCAFDSDMVLFHSYAETYDDYKKFRGSKYLQSKIGDCYTKVREFLNNDRLVMFTGTPCQIDGLKSYLKKDYNNLILVDLVCHGAPSPLVFSKYKNELEKKFDSKTESVSFRKKSSGWKTFSVSFMFKNKKEFTNTLNNDLFMRGFLKDLFLRPSCHKCISNGLKRNSDITLADYWGISNHYPEMDDDKGTSLILINSEKGKRYFDSISDKMKFIQTDIDYALESNPRIIKSVSPHKSRSEFFNNLDKYDFSKLIHKYCDDPFLVKVRIHLSIIKSKIKQII